MFFHQGEGADFGNRVDTVADGRHHFDDGYFGTARCEEFNHVQTNSTAADDNNFLTVHLFRIFGDMVNHIGDGRYFSPVFVDVLMKTFDWRQQWVGTGCINDDIRIHALDHCQVSFCIGEDEEVMQFTCTVNQIVREVGQTLFVRNLGDDSSQTAQLRLFLNQECGTSHFCRCAGSLKTGSTAADNDNVAWTVDFLFLVFFAGVDSRIDRTSDRAVDTDTMSGTADITGDTFADIAFIAEFYFVDPFRIGNQTTSHTDEVSVTSGKDIFGHLWVADVAHGHTWFAITFFDSFGHVRTPAVRQVVGINLVLNGTVETGGYVEDIHFFLEVLKIFQTVI